MQMFVHESKVYFIFESDVPIGYRDIKFQSNVTSDKYQFKRVYRKHVLKLN